MKKLDIPDREVLKELYIDKKKSLKCIADIFETTAMTVRSWLISLSIKTRSGNIELYKDLRSLSLSKIQRDLLVGSILGDGSLRIPRGARNAYFSERHSKSQLEYLMWKKDVLYPFVPSDLSLEPGGNHSISGVDCIVQDSYKLKMVTHPTSTELYNVFYRGNGNKIIPPGIKDYLNDFVIAVWFCDDGCLHNGRFDIHTESFSYEEQELLICALKQHCNCKISIYNRRYKSGIKHMLSLSGREAVGELLSRLIQHIPESMYYKFII